MPVVGPGEAPDVEVRRCAGCGEVSVVAVREWGTRRFFGLVDTDRISRTDYRCQHCGRGFRLLPAALLRLIVGGFLSLQFLAIGALILLAGLSVLVGSPAYGTALASFGGVMCALSLLALQYSSSSWWAARRNPVVPGSGAPAVLRYTEVEPPRRCTCGAPAPLTGMVAHTTNGVPTGTVFTHTCGACGATFDVDDAWGLVFSSLAAAFLAPIAALFFDRWLDDGQTQSLVGGGILGAFAALAAFWAGWGAVKRWVRHPLVPAR